MSKTIFVTGGAGFIGSALVRFLINETEHTVVNFDKLTYAGNLESLVSIEQNERYHFVQGDICNREIVNATFAKFQPDFIMHLAAESHVDRSIDGPGEFIQTNVVGTYELLEVARAYYASLSDDKKAVFLFHHISTDEVYGDLGETGLFTEETSYEPSSPYSASKAASDHLVRAWHRTYQLPVVLTNCSNNYGPYHFPEKLIPLIILNALEGKKLPVYGDGKQVRDWLFVEDHARALYKVVTEGLLGETYNIGGFNEKQNIEVVTTICNHLNELIAGEQAIAKYCPDNSTIVRTSWVYSSHGNNFVKTMLRLMTEKDELNVVSDQIGSPTNAKGLAQFLWQLAEQESLEPIYHYSDLGVASWYDFAIAIQEIAYATGKLTTEIPIKPIPSSKYPTPAKRPSFSLLTPCAHAVHWRERLKNNLREFK